MPALVVLTRRVVGDLEASGGFGDEKEVGFGAGFDVHFNIIGVKVKLASFVGQYLQGDHVTLYNLDGFRVHYPVVDLNFNIQLLGIAAATPYPSNYCD